METNNSVLLQATNPKELARFCGISPYTLIKKWLRPLIMDNKLSAFSNKGGRAIYRGATSLYSPNNPVCVKRTILPPDLSLIFEFLGLDPERFINYQKTKEDKYCYPQRSLADFASRSGLSLKTFKKRLNELASEYNIDLYSEYTGKSRSIYLNPKQQLQLWNLYAFGQ
ncbi:MAG: hypothetical protein NTY96_00310 [Bacteroidetes bacterium]|nr:hypothetical protein [Bacteroidota bacterium]